MFQVAESQQPKYKVSHKSLYHCYFSNIFAWCRQTG